MEKDSLLPGGSRSPERFVNVVLASSVATLASLNFGLTIGYTSPTQHAIQSDKNLHLSDNQFSWFAALIAVGAILGSIIGGASVDILGRKTTILATSIFYAPGWCLISYASNVDMLYAGRILTGVADGMTSLAVPLYIAEISTPSLRGGLCSISSLAGSLGIFLAYLVGYALSWEWLAMFAVMLTALMVILMAFMPETPRWLLAHNKRHATIKVLIWLRGSEYDVAEECFEIENNLDQQEKSSFADFKTPGLYKPLIIGSLLIVFLQFSGILAVLFFAADIFKSAGFNNAKAVAISVAGSQMIGTSIACLVVDKTGRRLLLMIGSIAMTISLLLLGIYYDIAKIPLAPGEKTISIFGHASHSVPLGQISWLAIISVIVYVILFSIGWAPLPWLLLSEIFPPHARGFAGGIVNVINWILVFVVTKSFNTMTLTFYKQGTFWFFGALTLASFFFVMFFVPETKGKTLEEIELMFTRGFTKVKVKNNLKKVLVTN